MTPEHRTRLVELIGSTTFTRVRVREGYDTSEVDDLLARVRQAVESGHPVADLVRQAQFRPVRLREGYDMGEVDALLDEVVAADDPAVAAAPVPPLPPRLQELADEVAHIRFTPVHLKPGYDMGEVDDFLDRVVAALRAGESLGAVLFGVDFTVVRFRTAYAQDEVDALLARLRQY